MDNMFQIRPSDLFGDCELTIVVDGCRYHQPTFPSGFACWGKAVITCPRSSPEEIAFIVRHPGGNTFMVQSGAILCEYERECSDNIATLKMIRCVV
jgi:hypothetical protein